jgi:hypothetical protein
MINIFFYSEIECVTANFSDLPIFVGCHIVLWTPRTGVAKSQNHVGELERNPALIATFTHNFEAKRLQLSTRHQLIESAIAT